MTKGRQRGSGMLAAKTLLCLLVFAGCRIAAAEPDYKFEVYFIRYTGAEPLPANIEKLIREPGALVAAIRPVLVESGKAKEIREGRAFPYPTEYTENGTPCKWAEEFLGIVASVSLQSLPAELGRCRVLLNFQRTQVGAPEVVEAEKAQIFRPSFERLQWEDIKVDVKMGEWRLFNIPSADEKNSLVAMRVVQQKL